METKPTHDAADGKPPEVSVGAALLTYFGLFALALLATNPDPRALPAALLFPVGLALASPAARQEGISPVFLLASYGLYAALLVALLAARRQPGGFLAVAAALALVLMVNVTGCHAMLGNLGH